MRLLLPLLLLLPALANPAAAASVTDPESDERALAAYYAPFPARCRDAAIDIVSLGVGAVGANLELALGLKDLDGALACSGVPLPREHFEQAIWLHGVGKTLFAYRQGVREGDATSALQCHQVSVGGLVGAPVCDGVRAGNALAWSLPLAGTATTAEGQTFSYDLGASAYQSFARAYASPDPYGATFLLYDVADLGSISL